MDRLRLERLSAGLLEWAVMLLPLLVYLLYLAMFVNRQRRPVVVSGAADQVFLLVGISGFLLVGPLTWPLHYLRGYWEGWYWIGYAAYVSLVSGLALGSIRRQRACYVVYNVDPTEFVEVLREVLKGLGIQYVATPGRLAWQDNQCVLDVAASYLGYSVTLRWQSDQGHWRVRVEPRLTAALKGVQVEGNQASVWLLLLATIVLFVILFGLAIQTII